MFFHFYQSIPYNLIILYLCVFIIFDNQYHLFFMFLFFSTNFLFSIFFEKPYYFLFQITYNAIIKINWGVLWKILKM